MVGLLQSLRSHFPSYNYDDYGSGDYYYYNPQYSYPEDDEDSQYESGSGSGVDCKSVYSFHLLNQSKRATSPLTSHHNVKITLR